MDVFESVHCPHCLQLKEDFFLPLTRQYPELRIEYHDLGRPENYRLFVKLREEIGLETQFLPEDLPIVFIGIYTLTGEEEIRKDLERLLKEYLPSSSGFPSEGFVSEEIEKILTPTIYLAYFYEPGCKECRTVEYLLKYLETRYPDLEIRNFDLSLKTGKELEEAICELLEVPEKQRLIAPALFFGRHFFIEKINQKELENALAEYRLTGTVPLWEEAKGLIPRAQEKILERFHHIEIPTVLLAGLIDGVNPCAFATIVFLIIYLTSLKRRKNEIFRAGLLFALAVFSTYFLLGLGLFGFIQRLSFIPFLRRTVFLLAAALTLVLAVLSLRDYFRAREGRLEGLTLQLSDRLKARIKIAIARSTRGKNYLTASLGLGVSVSLLEAVCTGQVYLPTIVFVAGVSSLRVTAFFYIFLYNLCFILPLLFVFYLTWLGVSSAALAQFLQRHLKTSKLLLTALFLGFTCLLIYLAL